MRIGIVGCGVISKHYLENAAAFDAFDVVACADVEPASAEALAVEHACVPTAEDRAGPLRTRCSPLARSSPRLGR